MAGIESSGELEHLFRAHYGRWVAGLLRLLGPARLDLAENAVQEALARAVRAWPISGRPRDPVAWVLFVARNVARDALRRERWVEREITETEHEVSSAVSPEEEHWKHDLLRLMFVCCHPALPPEGRVALALKTLCGFSVAEIARAFLVREDTIAQRLSRSQRRIRELALDFEIPPPEKLEERLHSVIDTIYLLFNEGYFASSGERMTKRELCALAISASESLASHSVGQIPKVAALLALMHFQFSRLNARIGNSGEALLLEEQDRALWDLTAIQRALFWLERAAVGGEISSLHLEAGIAACHALAPSFAETQWHRILELYDQLLQIAPSPAAEVARAVALAMAKGIQTGVDELKRLANVEARLKSYAPMWTALGELQRRVGLGQEALQSFQTALELSGNEQERNFIRARMQALA